MSRCHITQQVNLLLSCDVPQRRIFLAICSLNILATSSGVAELLTMCVLHYQINRIPRQRQLADIGTAARALPELERMMKEIYGELQSSLLRKIAGGEFGYNIN